MKVSVDLSLKDAESIIESAEKLSKLKEFYRQTDVLYNFANSYSPRQNGDHFRLMYCPDSKTEGASVRISDEFMNTLVSLLAHQLEFIERNARDVKLEVGE